MHGNLTFIFQVNRLIGRSPECIESLKYKPENTRRRGESITVQLVFSLTRLDWIQHENTLVLVCTGATVSKPVKLETNRTALLPVTLQSISTKNVLFSGFQRTVQRSLGIARTLCSFLHTHFSEILTKLFRKLPSLANPFQLHDISNTTDGNIAEKSYRQKERERKKDFVEEREREIQVETKQKD